MVDRLQNIAIAIGDVCILPVERYAVIGAVLVPEAQCGASRHWPELLIERAVSQRLVTVLLAMGVLLRVATCKCGMSSGVWVAGLDYRIVDVAVNHPRREAPSLESFVLDQPSITPRRCRCRRSCWRSRPACRSRTCGCWRRARRCGRRRHSYSGGDIDPAPAIGVVWRTRGAARTISDVNSRVL